MEKEVEEGITYCYIRGIISSEYLTVPEKMADIKRVIYLLNKLR